MDQARKADVKFDVLQTLRERDLLVEVIPAAELLTVNKELFFVVEVWFEIALQGVDQVVLEFAHVSMLAMCITEKAAVTDSHDILPV